MPDLRPQLFNGPADIPAETASALATNSRGLGMRDSLTALGWAGNPIGTICLALSTDGSRVANGWFSLWGALSAEPIEFAAIKLWDHTQRGTNIRISNITGQQFQFSSGRLQSDYADGTAFEVSAAKAGQDVPPAEWPSCGIGNMALRAIVHLDKTSNKTTNPTLKVTVLAVPLSATEMATLSERTLHPAWPGVKILEAKADLFPAASQSNWGCPMLPIIYTRDRDATITTTPSGHHLRFAIAEIMRTASLPTACVTRGAMNEKGQQALDDEDSLETRLPTITWPATERPLPDRGKTTTHLKCFPAYRTHRYEAVTNQTTIHNSNANCNK